jgi:hypothetical protein
MEKVSEVSPRLYHYTNEQGLYGILDNKCLWATHYKFLNDASEIELYKEKLMKELYPLMYKFFKEEMPKYHIYQKVLSNGLELDALAKEEIEVLVNSMYNLTDEIYIASFTGEHTNSPQDTNKFINENGLLSQWRAYADDGGFAIIFKAHELKSMLISEQSAFDNYELFFDTVVYSDDEKKYELKFSEFRSNFFTYLKDFFVQEWEGKQEMPGSTGKAVKSFVECITLYKHQGFRDEQEVRITAMPSFVKRSIQKMAGHENSNSKSEKERKFRDKNGQRTPYIELFRSDTMLPIEKIIVGPHKDKDSRAARLRVELRNTDIEVTVSEIPYQ